MTVEQIIRWFTDTDGYEFAEQIYGHTKSDYDSNGYLAGKFHMMQTKPIQWMASLDPHNRKRLEQAITGKYPFNLKHKGDA